jgi:hypothetical protein
MRVDPSNSSRRREQHSMKGEDFRLWRIIFIRIYATGDIEWVARVGGGVDISYARSQNSLNTYAEKESIN